MKTTYLFTLLISSLLILNACSDDSSTNAPTPTSPVTGTWTIFYSSATGGELMKKIEASFTLVENNGVVTGNAEITYINNEGVNDVEMIINDSVTGTFKENITPHIILNVSNGAFIYTGNWVNSGENFNGSITVNYNQQSFTETDSFLVKSDD